MDAMPSDSFEWLGPAEAVLKRPDMFVGPAEPREESELLFQEDENVVQYTEWTQSPILRKIFDEVFVNAIDAASRDESLRKITVTFELGLITIENDGRGIPVKLFKDSGRFIPEVIFSELNAGSNFEDSGKRLAGGRNGVGVVCANVWSTEFSIQIQDSDSQSNFSQNFSNNMRDRSVPEVKEKNGKRRGSVSVSFRPDYTRLGIDPVADASLLSQLFRTRCREGAVCVRPGVAIFYNGAKLPDSVQEYAMVIMGCKDKVKDLVKDEVGTQGSAHMSVIYSRRSVHSPECVAFVNGIKCSLGTHVRQVMDKICKAAQSKATGDLHVRPQTVRDIMGVVITCRIPDPAFTSQSKESLSTPAKSFGFIYDTLGTRAVTKLQRMGIFDDIFQRETDRDIAATVRKTQVPKCKDVLIDKYDPAIMCRSDPMSCTLILTEGDSAKELAVAGLSVLGRDHYGIFPLRGVLLNVRNVPLKKSLENKEIANMLRILNVAPGRPSEGLRYGRLAIMSDQDLDGAHIAALIINCIHYLVPDLLIARPDFLCRIVTPLLRATHSRTGEVLSFFSQQELDVWLQLPGRQQYKLKYYKGLGTNSALEAKEIFSDLERHTVTLEPTENTGKVVSKFFDESKVSERKQMLTEDYDAKLCVDYSASTVGIDAFLEKEVVHFSQYHVRRAIASAIDGLTPARRKVLFYFLSMPSGKEYKVAQAAAGVAQKTSYHHGEVSLVECIVGSAQDHVGTNNVALLEPLGQFGSRHVKPSTHAAARYIFTRAAPIARALFPNEDLPVLVYAMEEGDAVEPRHYVPVLPVVLLNGATGIGTGFSTCVPSFSLKSLAVAARSMMKGEPLQPLIPQFEGFQGSVEVTSKGVLTKGSFDREDDYTIIVTELPVGRWTESLLSELKGTADGGKDSSHVTNRALRNLPPVVSVANLSTDTRVMVRVTFSEIITDKTDEELASAFRLSTTIPSTFMYLFGEDEVLIRFEDYADIIKAHGKARLELYSLRRAHQLREMATRAATQKQKATFIRHIINGEIQLKGQSEAELVTQLLELGLEALSSSPGSSPGYEHLLSMSFRVATAEHIAKIELEVLKQLSALEKLEKQTPSDLWEEDLLRVEEAHIVYMKDHTARHADGPAPRRGANKSTGTNINVTKKRKAAEPNAAKAKKAAKK
jgi:DNA topoisomerase-2